ncbi:PqiC family protein [Neisseria weaveri]|uniref:PqiC family protein n=1 Tax=Neisseria weaveri TaxID=28091 RepID=UPI0007C9BBD6|nr:ABC-type transport auxiliary lipoprotein family protein [Neisseria weaveri]SAY51161.1 Lipoprotein [Neisseria weaveri]
MYRYAFITSLLLLAACSHTPPQYFVLPDSQYQRPNRVAEEMSVHVILAEPLNHSGLVYQTDAYKINFARQHLWASPLEQMLSAKLSNLLNRNHSRYIFVPKTHSNSNKILKIHIESFQGSYLGNTVIKGYAYWPDGRSVPFDISTPQQGDGYNAMVSALDNGLEQAAIMLAQ